MRKTALQAPAPVPVDPDLWDVQMPSNAMADQTGQVVYTLKLTEDGRPRWPHSTWSGPEFVTVMTFLAASGEPALFVWYARPIRLSSRIQNESIRMQFDTIEDLTEILSNPLTYLSTWREMFDREHEVLA